MDFWIGIPAGMILTIIIMTIFNGAKREKR
jgi:hypothetical protein